MIEAKVDQFNLVLRAHDYDLLRREEWSEIAQRIINTFEEQTKINQLFGKLEETDSFTPPGYDAVFNFNRLPAHAVAFSINNPDRGVLISTNAHFWSIWQQRYYEEFGQRLELYRFFKMIQNPFLYSAHFSRIDLAIDFIDEGLDVGKLYRSIMNGRSDVYYDTETKKGR